MGERSDMTDMRGNAPVSDQPDQQPDQQLDQQLDQDAEPPGSGIDGPVHSDEPAEGPE